jgi:hypothetical protein
MKRTYTCYACLRAFPIILKTWKTQHPKKDMTVDTTIRKPNLNSIARNHGLHIIMITYLNNNAYHIVRSLSHFRQDSVTEAVDIYTS